MKTNYLFGTIVAVVVVLVIIFINQPKQTNQNNSPSLSETTPPPPPPAAVLTAKISEPISNALSRVTKKHFGTHVTPKDSPVSPEKFTGYHTGVDFETTADEADTDVPIKAICDGKLLQKRTASGYGGIAVQSCEIDGQSVVVVYGHLKLASISAPVNSEIKAGDSLGVLGRGYSTETDGERKHLHLGIHKGSAVNVAGYVPNQSQLTGWMDAEALLK